MTLQSIDAINVLPPDQFAEAIRPLFEAAPPLAGALYARRPFASYAELIDTAERLTTSMTFDDQVRVLSAHPRIGASPDVLSAASYREQGGTEPAQVYTDLAQLNEAYEQRFGFRFVVFVNRRPKSDIVAVLRARLANSHEVELRTGLREMFLIARDRSIGDVPDDPARLALLAELRRRAVETYGEERAAETILQNMLGAVATAVWRISQEPLEPSGDSP